MSIDDFSVTDLYDPYKVSCEDIIKGICPFDMLCSYITFSDIEQSSKRRVSHFNEWDQQAEESIKKGEDYISKRIDSGIIDTNKKIEIRLQKFHESKNKWRLKFYLLNSAYETLKKKSDARKFRTILITKFLIYIIYGSIIHFFISPLFEVFTQGMSTILFVFATFLYIILTESVESYLETPLVTTYDEQLKEEFIGDTSEIEVILKRRYP